MGMKIEFIVAKAVPYRIIPKSAARSASFYDGERPHENVPLIFALESLLHVQLAAGHTRREAALQLGLREVDVFIGNFDDEAMIRVMATENSTQRGGSATATVGTVAAVLKILARGVMTGDENLRRNLRTSQHGLEVAQGQLANGRGIGKDFIKEFLKEVPRLTSYMIEQALTTLKASGSYSQIIQEVAAEVEFAEKERIAELERKEREAARKKQEAERARHEAEQAAAARTEEAARKKAEAKQREKEQYEAEREVEKHEKTRATRDTAQRAAHPIRYRNRSSLTRHRRTH